MSIGVFVFIISLTEVPWDTEQRRNCRPSESSQWDSYQEQDTFYISRANVWPQLGISLTEQGLQKATTCSVSHLHVMSMMLRKMLLTTGGPRREFFRLLVKAIVQDSGAFEGNNIIIFLILTPRVELALKVNLIVHFQLYILIILIIYYIFICLIALFTVRLQDLTSSTCKKWVSASNHWQNDVLNKSARRWSTCISVTACGELHCLRGHPPRTCDTWWYRWPWVE